jgi:hypothetical protein
MIAQCDGAVCVGVSIVIQAGTLMTGFVGPILSRCVIVSKMRGVGAGSFGVEVLST